MPVVFIATLALIAVHTHFHNAYGLSRLWVSLVLVLLGVVLHVVARGLHLRYLHLAAGELRRPGGTASSGAHASGVPRWVETLGNAAAGAVLAGLIPLVEEFVP